MALLGALSGCEREAAAHGAEGNAAEQPSESADVSTLEARLLKLDRDLTIGSSGDDVAAVHEYLERWAYLPSDYNKCRLA